MQNNDALAVLAALGQKTRLDAFRLLVQHEPDGLPAGELARQLDVPQNTLSTHLNILAQGGLVASERQSRSVIYRARLDQLQQLMLFLIEDCCGERSQFRNDLLARLSVCKPNN